MPRIISKRRAARERKALLNTVILLVIVVLPALALEICSAIGITAGLFDVRLARLFGGTAEPWFFIAGFAGIICHYFHCHFIWWWIKRKPEDPGHGGLLLVITYIFIWLTGAALTWSVAHGLMS
jgi:hypothetical protein